MKILFKFNYLPDYIIPIQRDMEKILKHITITLGEMMRKPTNDDRKK